MKLPIALKVVVIMLGVASATMLAWKGLGLQPVFPDFFLRVEQMMSLAVGPIEEFVVRPALARLRAVGADLELQPHWKHVFVLMWLVEGSLSRSIVAVSSPGRVTFFFAWLGFCSLLTAVLAGTVSPTDPRAVLWIVAGLTFSLSGIALWDGVFHRPSSTYRSGALKLALSAILVVVAATGTLGLDYNFLSGFHIGYLAGFVGLFGVALLLAGLSLKEDAPLVAGLDILFVLGGAAIFVALGQFVRSGI
jgi:hypothetical protein